MNATQFCACTTILCLIASCDKPKEVVEESKPAPKPKVATQTRLENLAEEVFPPEIKAKFLALVETAKTSTSELKKVQTPSPAQLDTYQGVWASLEIPGLPTDLKEAISSANVKGAEGLTLLKSFIGSNKEPGQISASMREIGHETHELRAKVIAIAGRYGVDLKFMQ
jgi:hypothetical protein